jgi:hypothetical protein
VDRQSADGFDADYGSARREGAPRMKVMFFTWLLLIATGLAFYTVIGLAHN